MWFILSISGAILGAVFYILNKHFLKKINEYVLGAGVFLTSFFVLFIVSLIKGIPSLNFTFLYAAVITALLNAAANILMFKALKTSDASLVLPILSFTPVFLILTSLIILKELPTRTGVFGIILIVAGSYILNFESLKFKKILYPFKKLFSERGLIYMFIVAFFFSITANYDKLAVINSDPIFGTAIIFLFTSIPLIIISIVKKQGFFKSYKANFSKFLMAGSTVALSDFVVFTAFTLQIVSYVVAIKRTSALFSVVLGVLIFKEKNITKRFLGAFIMVLGAVLILFGS